MSELILQVFKSSVLLKIIFYKSFFKLTCSNPLPCVQLAFVVFILSAWRSKAYITKIVSPLGQGQSLFCVCTAPNTMGS